MSTYTSSSDRTADSLPSNCAAPLEVDGELELMGSSPAMRRLRLQVRRIGPHFRTMVIRGEAGSGKEQVGRVLHGLSQGAAGLFVRCHAGALEDALPDSSAGDALEWLIGMARGGTLFLGGVEEMSPDAQAKLLRILRRHDFTGNGGETSQRLDVRVIAATGEDLRVLGSAGRFLQELYQRLATVEIAVPAVRERMEDLPELIKGLLDRLAVRHGCSVCRVAEDAMERMRSYTWPGDVLELENVLRSALLQSESGMIERQHLPEFAEDAPALAKKESCPSVKLQDVVERHMMRVLRDCGGNKLRAAERLGISRSTLYRMLDAGAVAHILR